MIIKNNFKRGTAVKILFYGLMGADIISAYSNFVQYRLLKNAESGIEITSDQADTNDLRQQVIAIIQVLLILGTIITFVMWFHRAYKNLHRVSAPNLQYTSGWAAGSWFVPFLNLGRPYLIMKEIWNETQNFILPKDGFSRSSSTQIIGWWWAFWLFSSILGNASGKMIARATTIDQLIPATQISIVSDAVDMISMILTLIMVIRMMGYEQLLSEKVNSPDISDREKHPQDLLMDIPAI
ncbi:MAG: DUF4328 domain-containing protein [Bacteroidetes bacterium]|nr:DUF4328 domain-containing protein [Bacteroidota bacterium]